MPPSAHHFVNHTSPVSLPTLMVTRGWWCLRVCLWVRSAVQCRREGYHRWARWQQGGPRRCVTELDTWTLHDRCFARTASLSHNFDAADLRLNIPAHLCRDLPHLSQHTAVGFTEVWRSRAATESQHTQACLTLHVFHGACLRLGCPSRVQRPRLLHRTRVKEHCQSFPRSGSRSHSHGPPDAYPGRPRASSTGQTCWDLLSLPLSLSLQDQH